MQLDRKTETGQNLNIPLRLASVRLYLAISKFPAMPLTPPLLRLSARAGVFSRCILSHFSSPLLRTVIPRCGHCGMYVALFCCRTSSACCCLLPLHLPPSPPYHHLPPLACAPPPPLPRKLVSAKRRLLPLLTRYVWQTPTLFAPFHYSTTLLGTQHRRRLRNLQAAFGHGRPHI